MQQCNDLRARISKDSMTTVYEQAWSHPQQYDKDSLDYFWRKRRLTLPDAALDNKYLLKPNGSVDGYSKDKEIQKLMQLRQLGQGSPWIVTARDRSKDHRIDGLFLDRRPLPAARTGHRWSAGGPGDRDTVMIDGFVPQPSPKDDHVIHCTMIEQFIQFRSPQPPQPGAPPATPQPPIPPDFMGR